MTVLLGNNSWNSFFPLAVTCQEPKGILICSKWRTVLLTVYIQPCSRCTSLHASLFTTACFFPEQDLFLSEHPHAVMILTSGNCEWGWFLCDVPHDGLAWRCGDLAFSALVVYTCQSRKQLTSCCVTRFEGNYKSAGFTKIHLARSSGVTGRHKYSQSPQFFRNWSSVSSRLCLERGMQAVGKIQKWVAVLRACPYAFTKRRFYQDVLYSSFNVTRSSSQIVSEEWHGSERFNGELHTGVTAWSVSGLIRTHENWKCTGHQVSSLHIDEVYSSNLYFRVGRARRARMYQCGVFWANCAKFLPFLCDPVCFVFENELLKQR